MTRVLRDIWLFFWRDLSIARTYRTVFVLEAVEALFGAAMFYYVARFVDTPELQRSLPQGGSYFAFSLVGLAVGHLLGGPDPDDRTVLALATCARHPAVALTMTYRNADQPGVLAAVLVVLLVASLVSLPYVRWRAQSHGGARAPSRA